MLYIGLQNNEILVVDSVSTKLNATITTVCSTFYITEILIDQSQRLYVSCM